MRLNFLSPLSPARSRAPVRIRPGLEDCLYLGNLNAERGELIKHHGDNAMEYPE